MLCSFEEQADVIGVINVFRAGHAQRACGLSGAASRQQQEPIEATRMVPHALQGRHRYLRPSGRGGCQSNESIGKLYSIVPMAQYLGNGLEGPLRGRQTLKRLGSCAAMALHLR